MKIMNIIYYNFIILPHVHHVKNVIADALSCLQENASPCLQNHFLSEYFPLYGIWLVVAT